MTTLTGTEETTDTMLRSLDSLQGYAIHATDEELGKVRDTYLDDEDWRVRYFVVDTRRWLPGRTVLLSPEACTHADWQKQALHTRLTRSQVEASPDVDLARPVSRRKQMELHQHYGWPLYWAAPSPASATGGTPSKKPVPPGELGDTRLRSAKEVSGYAIRATDGEIGHVEDFIVGEGDWAIRYLVVDTKNWLPGRKVLVSPEWIATVDWKGKQVVVDLTRAGIEKAPPYDPAQPVNRVYERQLYDYHGRPAYWV